jgi:hypothetical protein
MITLETLFTNLSFGELTNISIGDSHDGIIASSDYPKMLTHVKLALTDLHSRFNIRMGEAVIQQYSFIERYYLRPEFAVANTESTQPIKYIEDISLYGAEYAFQDDVLKIEKVTSPKGKEYRLNDTTEHQPIFTYEHDCLGITYVSDTPIYYVTYRADHKKLPDKVTDPSTVILNIPRWALEPLQANVAYRVLSGLGAGNPEKSSGATMFARYEFLCKNIIDNNLVNDDNQTNTKAEMRGWV